MDVVIDKLIIEADRPEHIARHKVTVDEVLEVVSGDYMVIVGRLGRYLLVGKTVSQRLITVVVGVRAGVNKYGLVTARITKKKEKLLYESKIS